MLLAIFSAILLILSFPNFNLNYLAFIGFVPIFFAIQNRSPKGAFLISWFCSFLFYLGTLYWLYHVTIAGLILICLYLALYFGIFGLLFNRITSQTRIGISKSQCGFGMMIFLIPAIWVILEYLQSHLFTGFGWTLLGYSQYKNLPLIQIADFSSVYGVSFVVMMSNVAIYRIFKKSFWEITVTAIVLVMVVGYGVVRLNDIEEEGNTLKISVIQGNIPQDLKWDPDAARDILNKYLVLTEMAALDNPDLIIWPETSFPGYFVGDKEMTQEVLELVKKIKTSLLLGANTESKPALGILPNAGLEERLKTFNSAVLISEEGEILDKYDKLHLVPFGEYVPFSDKLPFLHTLVLGQLGEFTPGKEFKIFNLPPSASHLASNFAVLICFEDIFPELARRFVQNGADFLVVITNDAWYGYSGAAYQHTACSVFRAIENRVSIVRCANTGYSSFIDSKGRIYDDVEENDEHLFITGYKASEIKLGR